MKNDPLLNGLGKLIRGRSPAMMFRREARKLAQAPSFFLVDQLRLPIPKSAFNSRRSAPRIQDTNFSRLGK